jgi:hypothetical protein
LGISAEETSTVAPDSVAGGLVVAGEVVGGAVVAGGSVAGAAVEAGGSEVVGAGTVGSVCGVAAIGADVSVDVADGSASPQAVMATIDSAAPASAHAARRDEWARSGIGTS